MRFAKQFLVQAVVLLGLFLICYAGQGLYGLIDRTCFPDSVLIIEKPEELSENEKGKLLLDAITYQMWYELNSTFGWTYNDLLFNRFLFDNRASRQYGVYHATKFLLDLYASEIAKLGNSDKESEFLYRARINAFAMDPRDFMFPSAEGAYEKGFELLEKYKQSLDDGKGVYNCRTDDIYATLNLICSENILGYALGLLQNAQEIPSYTLDNRIYEAQGIALVTRDTLTALYTLYPEISKKNNENNYRSAMECLDRICTYDPLYITSAFNSGELIISYLMTAQERIRDIARSLRI